MQFLSTKFVKYLTKSKLYFTLQTKNKNFNVLSKLILYEKCIRFSISRACYIGSTSSNFWVEKAHFERTTLRGVCPQPSTILQWHSLSSDESTLRERGTTLVKKLKKTMYLTTILKVSYDNNNLRIQKSTSKVCIYL